MAPTPGFSAQVRLTAAQPMNSTSTYENVGCAARKSLRESSLEETFASHEIASRKPTIFVKLTTDPPRCGSTSRKAITANRHRPMVRSAMTSTTNASPIAAATAILGSIPAAMPSSTATAATASCPARPRRSRRAAISGRRPYVLAARARLRSEGVVLGV